MPNYGPETPVSIFQHVEEFVPVLQLYRRRKSKKILEIGSYHGGTLYHWLTNAQPGAFVLSVDTYTAADNTDLYEEWCPDDVHVDVIRGDSRDSVTVAKVAKFAPFDWVFIDAGHYDEEVRDDWRNYGPMCERGVVIFHDIISHPDHPEIEVEGLWKELKTEYQTMEFIKGGEYWGGLGVVFK